LAISDGNFGAVAAVVDAAAPAFAVSAELNQGSFGADLQPIVLLPITRAKLNVRTVTRMASVPSNRVLFTPDLPGHGGLSGDQTCVDRCAGLRWHDYYNPYYWSLSACVWLAEQYFTPIFAQFVR
jgi:hypothetical protein